MPNFALVNIEGLPPHPVEPFFKLLIDGACPFDDFCQEMEKSGSQAKSLDKIQSIIVQISLGTRVPTDWFQELKHRKKGDPHKDYEIRAHRLRVYLFEDEEGKIIVLGELKKKKENKPSKAIAKMREIKLAYFASKG
ncbi:MAG: hypothetical protein H6577_27020 [Lewinellaceae bacterium]|nr:hypothetical protein [Saprospiraceae bacterium]MCB9341795.1 hypothetical protein [Lewinellaceae bacterium]